MNDQLQINLLEALTKMVNESEDAKLELASSEEVEQAKRDQETELNTEFPNGFRFKLTGFNK